jgi:hypothetical protein
MGAQPNKNVHYFCIWKLLVSRRCIPLSASRADLYVCAFTIPARLGPVFYHGFHPRTIAFFLFEFMI